MYEAINKLRNYMYRIIYANFIHDTGLIFTSYIVFAFSVIMFVCVFGDLFVCLLVCLPVCKLFFVKDFSATT